MSDLTCQYRGDRSDAIVSYLYGDSDPVERERFERAEGLGLREVDAVTPEGGEPGAGEQAGHARAELAGKAGLPRLMSTRDVIRFATADGARAAGLRGTNGSLFARQCFLELAVGHQFGVTRVQ